VSKLQALLFIVVLTLSSMIIAKNMPASDAASTPSIPEFSLKITARPYDVAPTATTDPYTGKTVITHGGYHVENKSIDVTIKNQPFTPCSANGSEINFYYQVQFKGYYGDNWQFYSDSNMITPIQLTHYYTQSNGELTVISVPLNSDEVPVGSVTNFPDGSQVDFRVRALIGSVNVKQSGIMGDWVYFNGETGDWSSTQTVTIGQSAAIPTATPTFYVSAPQAQASSTPIQWVSVNTAWFGLGWAELAIIVLLCIIAVCLVVLVVYKFRKHKTA
jgi:hypothetical protein